MSFIITKHNGEYILKRGTETSNLPKYTVFSHLGHFEAIVNSNGIFLQGLSCTRASGPMAESWSASLILLKAPLCICIAPPSPAGPRFSHWSGYRSVTKWAWPSGSALLAGLQSAYLLPLPLPFYILQRECERRPTIAPFTSHE